MARQLYDFGRPSWRNTASAHGHRRLCCCTSECCRTTRSSESRPEPGSPRFLLYSHGLYSYGLPGLWGPSLAEHCNHGPALRRRGTLRLEGSQPLAANTRPRPQITVDAQTRSDFGTTFKLTVLFFESDRCFVWEASKDLRSHHQQS